MFQVGAVRYRLRVTEEPLMLRGEPCDGLCDEGARMIYISPTVPVTERLAVTLHELAHAWFYAVGRPGDMEAACDLWATMTQAFHHDLGLCGGEEALRSLRPGETLGVMPARITLTRARPCGGCGGTIAPGSVFCHRDPLKPGEVKLAIYCEFCDQTRRWNELATVRGLPGGVPVGEERMEKGNTIGPAADLACCA